MWVTAKFEDSDKVMTLDMAQVERAEKTDDDVLFLWFKSGSVTEVEGDEQVKLFWAALQKYQALKAPDKE